MYYKTMKKENNMMKRTISLLLALCMVAALLAGCGGNKLEVAAPAATQAPAAAPEAAPEAAPADLSFAQGTILRMATGYNSNKTGLFFSADVAGEGIQLADG